VRANGIRCLARFLADSDWRHSGRRWQVETLAGAIVPEMLADRQAWRVWIWASPSAKASRRCPTTLQVGPAGFAQGRTRSVGGETLPLRRLGDGQFSPFSFIPCGRR